MAVINWTDRPDKAVPLRRVIHQGKKHVDIYRWKGLYVARGWPKKPKNPRTPKQQSNRGLLAGISKTMKQVTGSEWEIYANMGKEQPNQSRRDIAMRAAYGGLINWTNRPHVKPSGNRTLKFEQMTCSSHVFINTKQLLSGLALVGWSLVKPSHAKIIKTVLGESRACGWVELFDEAEEAEPYLVSEELESIFIVPPWLEAPLMYMWLFGALGEAAKTFTSALHVQAACHPTALHGTAAVDGNTFQPFTHGAGPIVLNAANTIEDPGSWAHTPGAIISVPIAGTYRIMAGASFTPFRPAVDVVQVKGRVQTSETVQQFIEMGTTSVLASGDVGSLVGSGVLTVSEPTSISLTAEQLLPAQIANVAQALLVVGSV